MVELAEQLQGYIVPAAATTTTPGTPIEDTIRNTSIALNRTVFFSASPFWIMSSPPGGGGGEHI
jgi:hypothetical protein